MVQIRSWECAEQAAWSLQANDDQIEHLLLICTLSAADEIIVEEGWWKEENHKCLFLSALNHYIYRACHN